MVPLLSTALFRNRTSNLGLVTQNAQWLLLLGVSFVVAGYLQVVRGYDAYRTAWVPRLNPMTLPFMPWTGRPEFCGDATVSVSPSTRLALGSWAATRGRA